MATRQEILDLFNGDIDEIVAWLTTEPNPPQYAHRWRLPNGVAAGPPTQWFSNTTIEVSYDGADLIINTDSDVCTYPSAIMEV